MSTAISRNLIPEIKVDDEILLQKNLFKIYLFIIYFEYSSNCVCQVELELAELLQLIQFSF